MKEAVFLKNLDTYGTVQRYWFDNSMAYIVPFGSRYGTWFTSDQVELVDPENTEVFLASILN
jgi:hypothetical protein